MPTVSVASGAYQDLDRIRQRIDYKPEDFYSDNEHVRFDELLVELETESRGIFETLWGDQTPLTETGRVDTVRPADDAAMPLVYPINDVTKVERKTSQAADWDTLETDWYDHTEHRLVLARRPNMNTLRRHQRANTLTSTTDRATWWDIAVKLRVTYDRGFGSEPPEDIKSIQIQLINRMLRMRKREQTVAAASPEEFAGQTETAEILTEELRNRISDVTKPGRATMAI